MRDRQRGRRRLGHGRPPALSGGAWFDDSSDSDCFYNNCLLEDEIWWGASLDVDDVPGHGPGTIRLEDPDSGTYAAGINYYDDRGEGLADVLALIYCNGVLAGAWEISNLFSAGACDGDDFLHLADVTWDAVDDSCNVAVVGCFGSVEFACNDLLICK